MVIAKKTRYAGVALAAAMMLAVGCETTLYLNDTELEQQIATEFQAQTGLVVTVSCPDDQPLMAGNVFECTAATADGESIAIEVTQNDAAGNVTWRTT